MLSTRCGASIPVVNLALSNWHSKCASCYHLLKTTFILDVVKRNPLFLHEIEWKNNGFLFTISNIFTTEKKYIYIYMCVL